MSVVGPASPRLHKAEGAASFVLAGALFGKDWLRRSQPCELRFLTRHVIACPNLLLRTRIRLRLARGITLLIAALLGFLVLIPDISTRGADARADRRSETRVAG